MHATRKRVWPFGLLALAAFFLIGAAWALALPVNGTYDENQHVVRAYAVVTGQWLPTGHAVDAANLPAEAFDAPRSLLPENANCTWMPRPPNPASCQREVTDRTHTDMPSQAARYSPVYYLLVGLPLRMSPDATGVVFTRLLSALLSAALLAAAVAIALRSRNRLLFAAIVLVSTPQMMNLYGSVNNNGLEISAGVLLFTALLTLVRAAEAVPDRERRWLLASAGVGATLLITVRQLGPVMFACVVAACLLVGRWRRVVEVLRSRDGWLLLGAPAIAGTGFAAWWLSYSRVTDIAQVEGRGYPYDLWEILRRLPGQRFGFYAEQVVARFSYGETTVSPLAVTGWYALMAALVLPAMWFAGARLRLAVAGVFAVCLAILVVGEVNFVPTFGWYSQSRYVAPLGVGVLLLTACAERFVTFLGTRDWLGLPVTLLVAATVPLDMYCLVRVMTRFQVGIAESFRPLDGSWLPAVGPVPVLVTALCGAAGLVTVAAVGRPWAGTGDAGTGAAEAVDGPPAAPGGGAAMVMAERESGAVPPVTHATGSG